MYHASHAAHDVFWSADDEEVSLHVLEAVDSAVQIQLVLG